MGSTSDAKLRHGFNAATPLERPSLTRRCHSYDEVLSDTSMSARLRIAMSTLRKPPVMVVDSLGTEKASEVDVDTLKWLFFSLGMRTGINLQMFVMGLLVTLSSNEAIDELSKLYYPLFRGSFLLSFFGVLFGLLLFTWKRTGIDYAAILGVRADRTNYHAVVRYSSSLMFVNFFSFVTFWLVLTVRSHLYTYKHIWPLAAFIGTLAIVAYPVDWMPEWHDAAQRSALAHSVVRALLAPFSSPSFACNFVADVFCSMPKCFIDLLYSTCIFTTGEAFMVGGWDAQNKAFDHELVVCTNANPTYRASFILLSVLPFYIRFMQCIRQIHDAVRAGSEEWRQPLYNAGKYISSLLVVILSVTGGRSEYWLIASIWSTLFAFSWDVLVDWGIGPQPLRRFVRSLLTPSQPRNGGEFKGASYWLRPVRVFEPKWYVTAIVVDLVARLGWAVYISPSQTVVQQHVSLLLGTVELLRRATWALLRVEWAQIERMAKQVHAAELQIGIDAMAAVTVPKLQELREPLLPPTATKEERIEAQLALNAMRMEKEIS
jgi:hypothetical protein